MISAAKIDLRMIRPVHRAVRAGEILQVRRMVLSGNDAITKGALEAGALYFAGYPITPATEVEEAVARLIQGIEIPIKRLRGTYLQAEDEIAAMGAIIGASLGGTKSFTATSGPGFSLKQENLGFACMCEIPVVVVNVQRGGPSTGAPTGVGQGDVMQAKWGTHGDHPIIVLAPATVQEQYEQTIRAFNLSEKYRTPVILLTDAKIAQMKEPVVLPPRDAIPIFDRIRPSGPMGPYEPYAPTESGVPPLGSFGDGYRAHFTGLNHGRDGLPTSDPKMIDEQLRRMHAKLETEEAMRDIPLTEKFLADDADTIVISFGITSRAARDAVMSARNSGKRAGLLRPLTLWPSDGRSIIEALARATKVIVAELNLGQYILEIQRLAYEMSRQYSKLPPEIVGVNKVNTQLITPGDILKEMTA